jgi:hypothetical protein
VLTDLLVKNASSDRLYVEDVFSTWLYSGNGSTQTITNGINLSGKGGMVWVKGRNQTVGHWLTDTSRGATKSLQTNSTIAQQTKTAGISSFSATGFNLGDDGDFNDAAGNYASWTFREAPKFFDIVTYTGNASARDISHSLGTSPGFIIIKRTDAVAQWNAWHRSLAANNILFLNQTAATTSASGYVSAVSSTTFSIGTQNNVNASGGSYVAYLFAHDTTADGIVQCGSFTTDGSGAYSVNLGWEPQFILVKQTNGTANWYLYDTMRGLPDTYNDGVELYPNTSGTEQLNASARPSATGFYSTNFAGAGATHIYMAIRRGPMKVPTDATKVLNLSTRTGTGATASISGLTSAPDVAFISSRNGWSSPVFIDRLRGFGQSLVTVSTSSEGSATDSITAMGNTSISLGSDTTQGYVNYSSKPYVNWILSRAPGFFDVVCYTGTGSATTVNHNLGVTPELMIVKNRTSGDNWICYHSAIGATKYLVLNFDYSAGTGSGFWSNTSPTSTGFRVGTSSATNASGTNYVAYLFATCAGVSKVGTYTGTGTTLQINCGFTNGARFVLIKRTDSTGDWYVWDSARGIIAGNDPYLLLNSTAAEVTNTDYVDAYSAGFELSSTAPAALNANGGTYIFLAIA